MAFRIILALLGLILGSVACRVTDLRIRLGHGSVGMDSSNTVPVSVVPF